MPAGLIDTSVVIDWDDSAVVELLPDEVALSTISLAELATGPHLTNDACERAVRQARLQEVEGLFDPIDFDRAAVRSYGVVVAAVVAAGRSHRARIADLQVAAIAHANGLTLYTRNPSDFAGLEGLITVTSV